MTALLNPANRKTDGVKWGLVSYTVIMFLVVTLVTGGTFYTQSLAYIDNREFPDGGPYMYRAVIGHEAIGVVPNLASISNYWLADAFLVSLSFGLRSLTQASNAGSSSSTAVTWYTSGTSGSSPSPA